MKYWYHVLIVLTPLAIGLPFLIFSIATEWWSFLDYKQIQTIDTLVDAEGVYHNYEKQPQRFKFNKLNGLFGNCYEYRWINVIVDNKYKKQQSQIKTLDNDDMSPSCLSRTECGNLYKGVKSCFCCRLDNNECCMSNDQVCNLTPECPDESDEIKNEDCKSKTIVKKYITKYYDQTNNCYREKYNYIQFLNHLLFPSSVNSTTTTTTTTTNTLATSVNATQQPFNLSIPNDKTLFYLNLISLLSLLTSVLFTVICFFTIIFVKCCSYQKESTLSAKLEYYDNVNMNEYTNYIDSDDDDDSAKSNCCRCTHILCPFTVYAIFSVFAFLTCFFGFIIRVYLVWLIRANKLSAEVFKLNSWLINIERVGNSLFFCLIATVFYFISIMLSTCVTCRIQMSPEYRSRYSDNYEVLQMQELTTTSSSTKTKKNKKIKSNK